ncbi:MAG: N-acetylmuramoyl-L-alanine amidase [Clostridia bacterium]|nr:N-acetylmuramoyl-L-alanine amidase [Clostridia bacterium]
MMIVVLKKKTVFCVVGVLLVLAIAGAVLGATLSAEKTAAFGQKVIVLDAGHGGLDRGVIGKNGTVEAEKNLEVAKALEKVLSDAGFFVVMTRTNDKGADEPAASFKQEDFKKRKATIEKYDPDLVLSVHCNKFPSSDRRGAQVFYNKMSAEGKIFAGVIQNALNGLNAEFVGKTFTALDGEYYMLNCTDSPSAIVECGFLSNPDDEALLNDDAYLSRFVSTVALAVIDYLEK